MEIDIPGPETGLDEGERTRLVQQAIDGLSWPLKASLLLAYFPRLSYAQISEELGIPLGTVKSRLHSAVAAFARRWQAISNGSMK
jgi:RNA polymerase sigma-70 factor (ECF subfamily)